MKRILITGVAGFLGSRLCDRFIIVGYHVNAMDNLITGNAMQTRSFCYVDDQVEGIFRSLHSNYVYPINIGNPNEITIKDFAKEIIKLTATTQKLVYFPFFVNDQLQRQTDKTKIKKMLVWEAKILRSEGMKISYKYFKSLSSEEILITALKNFTRYIH